MNLPECNQLKLPYDDCIKAWVKNQLPKLDFQSISKCNLLFEVGQKNSSAVTFFIPFDDIFNV